MRPHQLDGAFEAADGLVGAQVQKWLMGRWQLGRYSSKEGATLTL